MMSTRTSRRNLMAGGVAAAAGATLGVPMTTTQGKAQAAPTSDQAPGFYRYKIGDLTVTAINDGFSNRSVEGFIKNAELADVQAALEQAFLPRDAFNVTFTSLAVQNGDNLTLIDTGNGDSGAPTSGTWMANFKAAGFDPADVSTVVFSHFHGDHINGFRLKDGSTVFANAQVLVPEAEWSFWMDDSRMNAAPEQARANFHNVRRVFGPIADKVERFAPGTEVVPGLTAVAAPGHTPGHTVFTLSSGDGRLMVMSDTTNHPALFVRNPDWSASFDMDGPQAVETRRKLLDRAAADRMQVAFYHAPFPATGHIARDGSGFQFVPIQWSAGL